ncbi:nucleotide-diphospho-sugar transferase [Rhodotorula toruloides]
MPPEVYPAALNPFKRANAAFVALVRNGEREAMRDSMRSVESRFNRRFGYPWVFLNDEPFDEDFKVGVMKMTRSEVFFAQIPKEHWSYPEWINQTYAADERQKMVNENVIYGGSESYRHMCRFNSGFFFKQKILESFDWYWRVEPGVELFCDIDYDVFHFMEANNKVYGFTIVLYEYLRTVETLWDATREFARLHPDYIHPENTIRFLVDDEKKGLQDGDWNLCHFWSNFEIGSLKFWRSQPYEDYFKFLDGKGGFFYERWGDAPVHSFAAALFLPQSAIHNFYDISYRHNPYQTCPQNRKLFHDNGKCECYPENSFDTDGSVSLFASLSLCEADPRSRMLYSYSCMPCVAFLAPRSSATCSPSLPPADDGGRSTATHTSSEPIFTTPSHHRTRYRHSPSQSQNRSSALHTRASSRENASIAGRKRG